jgi:hypothetical protein
VGIIAPKGTKYLEAHLMDQESKQKEEKQLDLLPGLFEALITDVQNLNDKVESLEERESTRSLNVDRVKVIDIDKKCDRLSDLIQVLVTDIQNLRTRVEALEEREGTRSLNTDRVRIIDLEKKYEQLAEAIDGFKKQPD